MSPIKDLKFVGKSLDFYLWWVVVTQSKHAKTKFLTALTFTQNTNHTITERAFYFLAKL